MIPRSEALDPRTWVVWGVAAAATPLLGRNPFPVAVVLLAALAVRSATPPSGAAGQGWSAVLRLAVVVATLGVVLNVLTVRAGDLAIVTIPEGVPLLDGTLTWNAAIYGLLSGLGLVTLVVVGTVVGSAMDWAAVVRLLPDRVMGVAVAGSIAFNVIPQTAVAFTEIREAQRARGHRVRSARDLVPLLVPLLNGGIDRAMGMAEVLESRGFGATPGQGSRWSSWLLGGLLTCAAVAAFGVSVGRPRVALAAAVVAGGLAAALAGRKGTAGRGRTRYRVVRLGPADWVVMASALTAAATAVVTERRTPGAVTYEPYPGLSAPLVSLPLLAGLLLLLAPCLVLAAPADVPPG